MTQTPPGAPARSLWGGVLHYTLTLDDAGLVQAAGIDAGVVADPVGLAFRSASSEVFVGNRHGETAADGIAGSISRLIWNSATQTLTPNGTITGNGLNSVTQVAFNPVSGELFAANYTGGGGVSRFVFDSQGNATPNGTIGSGAALGVNVAPDGARLYITFASNQIAQFDLGSGTQLTSVAVSGATVLQQIAFRGSSEMYIPGGGTTVYRFALDSSDNLTLKGTITGATAAIGVAFSPDALEMFTGGHQNTDVIDRFRYDAPTDSWIATTTFTTPASLGYYLVLPDSLGRGLGPDAGESRSDAASDGSTLDAASDAAHD